MAMEVRLHGRVATEVGLATGVVALEVMIRVDAWIPSATGAGNWGVTGATGPRFTNGYYHKLANGICRQTTVFTYIVPFRSDFVRQPGSDFGCIDIAEIGGRSHVGDDFLDRVFCDPADIVGNSAMFVSKDQAFRGRGISR